jgi:hypothetical protein
MIVPDRVDAGGGAANGVRTKERGVTPEGFKSVQPARLRTQARTTEYAEGDLFMFARGSFSTGEERVRMAVKEFG